MSTFAFQLFHTESLPVVSETIADICEAHGQPQSFKIATANGLCQLKVSLNTSPLIGTQKFLDTWWPQTTESYKNLDDMYID